MVKTHSCAVARETKLKMVLAKSKIPLGLYDINNNLIKTFINQVELANYLNIHKSTVGKYYKSGKFITLPRKINIIYRVHNCKIF